MKHSTIIVHSLKETFALIKKHLFLFFILFFLQLIFFFIMFGINYTYQVKAIEAAQDVVLYLEQQQLDDTAIASGLISQQDILGQDPALIHRKYIEMIQALLLLVVLSFLAYTIINGINWNLTDAMLHNKKIKDFLIYQLKFFAVCFIYAVLVFLFFYLLIKASLINFIASLQGPNTNSILLLFFIIIVFYFSFISLSLIGVTSFKEIWKKTWHIGIKKFLPVSLTYLINMFILLMIFMFLYFASSLHVILLVFFGLVFFFAVIVCRIFLMNTIRNLGKTKI